MAEIGFLIIGFAGGLFAAAIYLKFSAVDLKDTALKTWTDGERTLAIVEIES